LNIYENVNILILDECLSHIHSTFSLTHIIQYDSLVIYTLKGDGLVLLVMRDYLESKDGSGHCHDRWPYNWNTFMVVLSQLPGKYFMLTNSLHGALSLKR
jgi:hypothetical protein